MLTNGNFLRRGLSQTGSGAVQGGPWVSTNQRVLQRAQTFIDWDFLRIGDVRLWREIGENWQENRRDAVTKQIEEITPGAWPPTVAGALQRVRVNPTTHNFTLHDP
jgi:hypothetical protein